MATDDRDNPLADQDRVTTKYGSVRSSEWKWRHQQNKPRMTDHLLERWDERTPAGSVSPEVAWDHAVGVGDPIMKFFTDEGGQQADDVRLYYGVADGEPYTMYFIVMGSKRDEMEYHARTVYAHESFEDPRAIAYLEVVREQAQSMYGEYGADGPPAEADVETAAGPDADADGDADVDVSVDAESGAESDAGGESVASVSGWLNPPFWR